MKDLIPIKVENDQQLVSARDLHKALGFKKKFSGWWEQNQDQFEKGIDFNEVPKGYIVESGNGTTRAYIYLLNVCMQEVQKLGRNMLICRKRLARNFKVEQLEVNHGKQKALQS